MAKFDSWIFASIQNGMQQQWNPWSCRNVASSILYEKSAAAALTTWLWYISKQPKADVQEGLPNIQIANHIQETYAPELTMTSLALRNNLGRTHWSSQSHFLSRSCAASMSMVDMYWSVNLWKTANTQSAIACARFGIVIKSAIGRNWHKKPHQLRSCKPQHGSSEATRTATRHSKESPTTGHPTDDQLQSTTSNRQAMNAWQNDAALEACISRLVTTIVVHSTTVSSDKRRDWISHKHFNDNALQSVLCAIPYGTPPSMYTTQIRSLSWKKIRSRNHYVKHQRDTIHGITLEGGREWANSIQFRAPKILVPSRLARRCENFVFSTHQSPQKN